MPFDATRCRLLLVGKMLAKLGPFLEARGYNSVVAEPSGASAATLLAQESFDLVLLELNLRDIELRDFFRQARRNQADASFLLLAAPSDAESVVSALVLGADGYIPLPPDEKELMQVLSRHGMAAMQRKNEDPGGQPGVAERIASLEQQLESMRSRHQAAEAAQVKLTGELKQAKDQTAKLEKELVEARKTPSVPAGHKVIELAKLEALEQRADFADFLESENDEVKKERDALRARVGALSGSGDANAFDESTGTFALDDDTGEGGAAAVASGDSEEEIFLDDDEDEPGASSRPSMPEAGPTKAVPATATVGTLADDDSNDDDFMGEMSEEIDLAAIEALAKRSPGKPAPPPGPVPPPFDTSELELNAFTDGPGLEELSSEFDLAAIER
ncbi:MAG: response regulator, partial [Myxococcota bacterium]